MGVSVMAACTTVTSLVTRDHLSPRAAVVVEEQRQPEQVIAAPSGGCRRWRAGPQRRSR